MSDKDWYLNEDGSRYAVFLQVPDDPNEQYSVDFVRHAEDEHGLLREQRLTLAQYNSYGEAEEHFYEAEQQMQNNGLEDFDVDALVAMPYSDTPTILTAHFPPDAKGDEHITTNILAVTEDGIQSARIATGDIETQQRFVEQLDLAQIEGGDDHLLDEAMELAEAQEHHTPATPLFQADDNAIRHVDSGGTTHWFGITEREDDADYTHELRYFRSYETDDDELQQDSYPVMPLPDGERETAWVLPDLERHLQTGNIYTAQQMAHNVADFYEQDFPYPLDLPALNPEPEYYFGYGIGPSDSPSLEVVKTWMDGAERRFDTLTVAEYGMFEEAAVEESDLEELLETEGLEAAMNLAETMAVAGGYLDPERDDPRIFLETNAPSDPFQTIRQAELQEQEITVSDDFDTEEFELEIPAKDYPTIYAEWAEEASREREANASLEGTEWFEATFDDDALLEPLDPIVNYAVTLEASDPWTLELAVEKVWKAENGYVGFESQTVQAYDPDEDRETAEVERDTLLEVYDERGLEAMMHKAELKAMKNGYLDPHRANLGLFRDGPKDRFETLAQQLEDETNPYWNTDGEVIDEPKPENTVQNPYWRLDALPVNDPDGEPLGQALHIVVYPDVPDGMHDEITEDAPFQMMEMAHFEKEQQMENFSKEFRGYLIPDLLEGHELAKEVARLEGFPAEYTTLEGQELEDYRNAELTLTRTPEQWHPYNPNAEREARLEAEGLYTDPIHQHMQREDDINDGSPESKVPDFDL